MSTRIVKHMNSGRENVRKCSSDLKVHKKTHMKMLRHENAVRKSANWFNNSFSPPLFFSPSSNHNDTGIMEHSTDEDDPTQDTQDHFVGMISHLKIWKNVLSESEIRYSRFSISYFKYLLFYLFHSKFDFRLCSFVKFMQI